MIPLLALSASVDKLTTSASYEDRTIVMKFGGEATMKTVEPLGALLSELHTEAQKRRVSSIVLDFQEFEFMNSSCFKKFAVLIDQVRLLDKADHYRIRFSTNTQRLWQHRSLQALQVLAPDLVSIETNDDPSR